MEKQNTDFKSKLEEGYDYYQKGEQQKCLAVSRNKKEAGCVPHQLLLRSLHFH